MRAAAPVAVATVAVVAALLVAAPPVPAAVDVARLSDSIAAPWPGLQRRDGSFPEYLPAQSPAARRGRDRYGEAMMGYGLLLAGSRSGDAELIEAGLDAVTYASAHQTHDRRVVFENLALAASYNLLRESLPGHPRSAATAARLRPALRRARVEVLDGPRPYFNYHLVEAVAVLELLRSGVRSNVEAAVLADRGRARRLVDRLLRRRLPRLARAQSQVAGVTRTAILSDPPWNPPAYHAFSLALVVRAARLTDDAEIARRLSRLVDELVAASAGLMGPDGDVSYFGRSQEQSWTLAMTAYGGLSSSGPDGATVAARALRRLEVAHMGGAHGVFLTPALRADADRGLRGLDAYVSGPAYAGLTIVGLEWAAAAGRPPNDDAAPIALDAADSVVLGRGASAWVTVRAPALWYAVKQAPAVEVENNSTHARDLRYDSGLTALKARRPDGSWFDVVPLRPRANVGDGAGPVLLGSAGGRLRMVGRQVVPAGPGAVRLRGSLRDARTGREDRHFALTYAPSACGLSVTFGVRQGERFEQSLFFRHRPTAIGADRRGLSDGAYSATLSEKPAGSRIGGGYASGADPVLFRVRLTFRRGEARKISLSLCGSPGDDATTRGWPPRDHDADRVLGERARGPARAGLGGELFAGAS